jgi:hypothetical protein
MSSLKMVVLVAALGILILARATPARADGAWLDQMPPAQWNAARMSIPAAPAVPAADIVNPQCTQQARPPDTDEDEELVRAGWYLVGHYEGGWGMLVVTAAANFDGMCRPLAYQEFVFVNGIFAGTVSPVLMDSRTDGAAVRTVIQNRDGLMVQFNRYAESDALCCPSRTSQARFGIDRAAGAPVLVLMSVFTQATS